MGEQELTQLLSQAQQGDQLSRERIIRHYKAYILNVASRVTKRYLTWSDEESSIALTAFNKAIDEFKQLAGKKFLHFCYLLITRDMIDFFRREQRHQHVSLDDSAPNGEELEQMETTVYENKEAEKQFSLQEQQRQLVEEILIYDSLLREYELSFQILPDVSPKHQDTRVNCFRLARIMIANEHLMHKMKQKKRLPITELSKIAEIPSKTIEKNRKYIIAVTLCLHHPDLEQLKRYIEKGGDT